MRIVVVGSVSEKKKEGWGSISQVKKVVFVGGGVFLLVDT